MHVAMSTTDPTDLAAQAAAEAASKEAAETEEKREIDDLKWLMGSLKGRRVMWRLLRNAGAYRLSHTPGDPYQTAFNEGSRNVGNRLIALLMEHAGEDYGLMVKERSNVRS